MATQSPFSWLAQAAARLDPPGWVVDEALNRLVLFLNHVLTSEPQAMQRLLRAVVRSGTGRAASLGGQEGGKTGTTNDGRDLLFIGSEPQRQWTIGIWLGNDDNRPTHASSALAAGLWSDIIRSAGQGSLSPQPQPPMPDRRGAPTP